MPTKTITIMQDAYELLKADKKPNESFSDTIRRNFSKKTSMRDFFGSWDGDFADEVKTAIDEMKEYDRKHSKLWKV